MRKGPLDRYSVESILQTAAGEGLSGAIEIDSNVSGTVYLHNGYVYFALVDGVPAPPEVAAIARPSKDTMRRYVESTLCDLCHADGGWYRYDPLENHPDEVRWVFQVDGMLRAVRARNDGDEPIRRWSAAPMALATTGAPRVRLDDDMWNLVVAMTNPISSHQLRDRLDWDADRLAVALTHLEQAGLLDTPTDEHEPEEPGTWNGTPDLAPRPLPTPTSRDAGPQPTRAPAASSITAPLPERALVAVPDRGTDDPLERRAATLARSANGSSVVPSVAPPAAAAEPDAAEAPPTRKRALKRLIDSLRQ